MQHQEATRENDHSVVLGISYEAMWLVVICLADAVSTVTLVSLGYATEYNPVMAWLLRQGALVFFVGKILTFVPFVAVCEVYRRKDPARGRLFVRWALGLYLVFYTGMVTLVNMGVI